MISNTELQVSIPSLGSGKGDSMKFNLALVSFMFQSPLGEVVKETIKEEMLTEYRKKFQSPLGEVVKET